MTTEVVILRRTIVRMAIKKINPEAYYSVTPAIATGEVKPVKDIRVKGGDLTFNQIAELAVRGHFD